MLVTADQAVAKGKRNEAAFRIIVRNSRLSEHLKGDLDAEQGAARLGCRRIEALAQRYGVDTLEQAFDQLLQNTAAIFRREILPKIKDGVYHFEDYIEADGVDEPRSARPAPHHDQDARTRSCWTSPAPIRRPRGRSTGRWTRLRGATSASGSRRRCARSPPVRSGPPRSTLNEGVLDVIEVKFPPKGTLITPHFGRPTGMRFS